MGFDVIYQFHADMENFDKLFQALQQDEKALRSQHSRILINEANCTIGFGCGLPEISASFPNFARCVLPHKNFSFSNISNYSRSASIEALSDRESEMRLRAARTALLPYRSRRDNPLSLPTELTEPENVLLYLVDQHEGLVIGESHDDRSPKQLLIHAMSGLKEKGVTHIYLENLFSDTQSDMLEYYFSSSKHKMPVMLSDYLNYLDKKFSHNNYNPGFRELVVAAKENGIKIIPMSTYASYYKWSSDMGYTEEDATNSYILMHQQMKSLLDERKEGKYIIFCGADHLLSNRDVPSIMQIAGNNTLSMVVSDKNDVKHANDHYTKPDVLMVINPHSKAVNTTTRQPTVQEHSFFRPDPAKIVTIHSISRDEAKLALQNTAPGTYLVRFPSSRGELVLSMKTARNIDHIVIDKREGKYSVEFDNRGNDLIQANSLNELIEELKRTKILLEEKVLAPKPASP